MKNRNPISQAVQLALMTGVATSIGTTAWAAEAESEDEAARLSRVEVTGSRIKRPDIESSQPLLIIQREDIQRTGLTSVGDLLQDLPIAGSALNTTFNNGGNGATTVDLRNLGTNRVLVLVNGRRWVWGAGGRSVSGSVDLNTIPVSIIERIEVLKDGASAIYGSDAIAGVVNIITRRDFEGLAAGAQYGEYDEGDGAKEFYDFSVGTSSAKTSAYVNVSYRKQEPVSAGDREISSEPQYGTGFTRGSSGTPRGRFLFIDPVNATQSITLTPGTQILQGGPVTGPGPFGSAAPPTYAFDAMGNIAGDFIPWGNPQRFNFAPDNWLETPLDIINAYAQVSHEISDNITFVSEILYNNRKSDQLLAPTPLFLGAFGSPVANTVVIDANQTFNPFGITLDPNGTTGTTNFFFLGRRMVEAGNRIFRQDVDTWRFGGGFEGSFEAGNRFWDWNAFYTYSKNESQSLTDGLINVENVRIALGPPAVCASTTGCVPFNVFSGLQNASSDAAGTQGSITPAMVDYITFVAQESNNNEMVNYVANISSDIAELPAGPLGFAFGWEYREQKGFDQPDALIVSGVSSGNARLPTSGAYTVDEFYTEFNIPILADMPGADRLTINVAARYSDYSTFGDTTNTKYGLEYKPIDDLLLRASFSEGFRAPNINELFGGQGDSFPTISDPCSNWVNSSDPVILNNCPNVFNIPMAYVQPNSQIRTTVGSNPTLAPETADSTSFGFVYSPNWAEGLDFQADWYRIELVDTITVLGAQFILNDCVRNLTPLTCSKITRGVQGNVSSLINTNVNIGATDVEGVDVGVLYNLPEYNIGDISLAWDSSYVTEYKIFRPSVDPTQFAETSGAGRNFGDTDIPRWKSNLDVNWTRGDWAATWGMRYVQHAREFCSDGPGSTSFSSLGLCSNPYFDAMGNVLPNAPTTTNPITGVVSPNPTNKLGSVVYHDVQVSYQTDWYDTNITVGVQNLFDKQPPISVTAFANSFNAAEYLVPGVFPYIRITSAF